MRRLPLAALLLALLLAGCGDEPGRVVISPAAHDFGRVQQGEKPTVTFTVTNHTDRVVSVMPQPNCSCFAVPHGRSLQPLDPGASMQVDVLFDSTAKPPGPVEGKYITFNLDHPTQRKIIAPVSGEIYRVFDLRPDRIDLGRIDGRPKNHEARILALRPRGAHRVRVLRAVASPDVFAIDLRPDPEGGTDVAVTLPPDPTPRALGAFRAQLRLELEVTPPEGEPFAQRVLVPIVGTWALKPDGTPVR